MEYSKWSRKSSSPPLMNPCPVSSLDAISEIWTGLQLLTTTLAPFRDQRITSFSTSYRDKEIVNASDLFPPLASHPCQWRLITEVELFLCNTGTLLAFIVISHARKVLQGSRCSVTPTLSNRTIAVVCGCSWVIWSPTLIWHWPTRTQGIHVRRAWAAFLSLRQQHSET